MELEAEAALGADRTSLAAAELGSAPEAAVPSAVPTPQTGISIPMMATPRFVRKVPEDGMEIYGNLWNRYMELGKKWGVSCFLLSENA